MASKKKTNLDGLMNVITGMGTQNSKRSNNQWQFAMLGNWQELDSCYQSSWIARKICDIPAEDMTREWRRIKSDGAEEVSKFEEMLMLPNMVQEAVTWARLYGGAGILMLTGQDLTKPLKVNQIKKGDLKRLIVLDRWDMSPLQINTWDVLSPNYLKPESYSIRGGSQQIHYSHFARFTGERLPLRYMAQTQGWGDSVLRKCIEDITDMVAAKNGIAELMQEANVNVITRPGLTEELSTDQDENIINRYTMFRMMISNFQMALLDGGDGSGAPGEKLDRQTLNLSGVAPIIEQFMTWISGAADIPVTRMFGTSAKGMNATGEGDDKNYSNSIRAQQRSYLAEPMRTLDEVIVRSALGFWPDDYSYVWNPLSIPNDLEHAQAEQLRSQKHLAYMEAGVVQKSQIQRELQAAEEYQFDEEQIGELEALEDGNMFDEPVDPARAQAMDEFVESEHPRDETGKFASGSGAGSVSPENKSNNLISADGTADYEKINEIAQNSGFDKIGIRVVTGGGSHEPGDDLDNSYEWVDGESTGNQLEGVSALDLKYDGFDINQKALSSALKLISSYGKENQIILVGSNGDSYEGNDPQETVLSDAVVISVLRDKN